MRKLRSFYWSLIRIYRHATQRCLMCGKKINGQSFMNFTVLCRWCGKSWLHGQNYGLSKERFVREVFK